MWQIDRLLSRPCMKRDANTEVIRLALTDAVTVSSIFDTPVADSVYGHGDCSQIELISSLRLLLQLTGYQQPIGFNLT